MASMIDDINHLSNEIGARPAGTEEERLAAMYIGENIQKRSGLSFDIEDFESANGRNRVRNVLPIISSVLLLLCVFLNLLTIFCFVACLAIAVILVLEYLEKPVISNYFRNGVSQNVVVKYSPSFSADNPQAQRKRKVVLVSHYDTSKAIPGEGPAFFKFEKYSRLVSLFITCFIPILLFIKMIFFSETFGASTLFFVILSLLLIIVSLIPLLTKVYKNKLLYNNGANCNASGNAALIEIARRIGTGAYSDLMDDNSSSKKPYIHGSDAAKAKGAVPEGAKLDYQTSSQEKDDKSSSDDLLVEHEQNLENAKAAVAAFTAPRKARAQYDSEGNVINEQSAQEEKKSTENITIDDASAQRASLGAADFNNIESKPISDKPAVPEWFKTAQSRAKKKDNEDGQTQTNNIQRSRFAHTDDVMQEIKNEAELKKQEEEELKREKLREQIAAAKAAAEQERQEKFGDEKPFYRSENDADSTMAIEAIKDDAENNNKEQADNNDDLSIDERFKLRQKSNSQSKNQEQVNDSNDADKVNDDDKVSEDVDVQKDQQAQDDTHIDTAKDDANINTDNQEPDSSEQKQEEESNNTQDASASGSINLENIKQYAPLDDESFVSSNQMPDNSSLNELPEVFDSKEDIEKNPEYNKALDQANVEQANNEADDNQNVSDSASEDNNEIKKGKFGTGSFAAVSQTDGVAGATGTFSPVTDELIEDASKSGEIANKEDMVIADADDEIYSKGEFTDSGAFAGKGYVDMPEKKRGGLLGVFGKNKENSSGGKHAGKSADKGDNLIDDSAWEGGAFSGISNILKKDNIEDPAEDSENLDAQYEELDASMQSEDLGAPITNENSRVAKMVDAVPNFEEQIQDFHNTSINIDVWMVALGSEIDENSGMRTFLMEHAEELRGAIIIDIEGVGAGELSLVNSEGLIKKSSTSSRLKRYIRQASNKLGIAIPSVNLSWSESSALYANKKGYKTIRLVGMQGDCIANYMSKDDNLDQIDEVTLNKNVNYLMELIQCI